MNIYQIARRLALVMLVAAAFAIPGTGIQVRAQDKKPVMFKTPDGYMPVDFPKHLGKLMLAPKNPSALFVAYPAEGQDMNAFVEEIKTMAAQMFLHDTKQQLTWTSVDLPSNRNVEGESGSLMTTSDEKMEVQVAFYKRPEGVAYGYFGMRHKKPAKDDAKFLDLSGAGVKAFDELSKTIK